MELTPTLMAKPYSLYNVCNPILQNDQIYTSWLDRPTCCLITINAIPAVIYMKTCTAKTQQTITYSLCYIIGI